MEDSLSPIPWAEVLETGVPELDDQHRSLIDQCNAMGALLNGGSWHAVVDAARELAESCTRHFRSEEALLEQTGFPRTLHHKAAHHEIEKRFDELVRFLAAADGDNPEHRKAAGKVRTTLVDLLFRHDLDYKSHLLNAAGR
jgi:hemerythrin-like metal-binding protein